MFKEWRYSRPQATPTPWMNVSVKLQSWYIMKLCTIWIGFALGLFFRYLYMSPFTYKGDTITGKVKVCEHMLRNGKMFLWLKPCQSLISWLKHYWGLTQCYDFLSMLTLLRQSPLFLEPLMSQWHHHDIIIYDITITSLWPHSTPLMISSLPMTPFYSTTTSSPKHYKYDSIS